jgi:hypothetical protein
MPFTIGDFVQQLRRHDKSKPVCFCRCPTGLQFYRLKVRGEHLLQLEFNECVYRNKAGKLIVQCSSPPPVNPQEDAKTVGDFLDSLDNGERQNDELIFGDTALRFRTLEDIGDWVSVEFEERVFRGENGCFVVEEIRDGHPIREEFSILTTVAIDGATSPRIDAELFAEAPTKRARAIRKIVSAALSAIPWVGGFLAAMIAYREESKQMEVDALQRQWIEEHKLRMAKLAEELEAIAVRLDSFGDEVTERLESEEYLGLIRKGFRVWDQADTDQKRSHIAKLLAHAGATKLADDDLIRLFLDWLERYHEAHFSVIREIYKKPGITRREIWENIHGTFPRDDSSEADLFRLLIGDLSTGRIIRQHREVTYDGRFEKKARTRSAPGMGSTTMKSAFDDEEGYELTQLGKKFVHYVFTEVVQRIENSPPRI